MVDDQTPFPEVTPEPPQSRRKTEWDRWRQVIEKQIDDRRKQAIQNKTIDAAKFVERLIAWSNDKGSIPTETSIVGNKVDLTGFRCSKPLNLSGRFFDCELSMRDARLEGSLDLSECVFAWAVDLAGIDVGGECILRSSLYQDGLNLRQAHIDGDLWAPRLSILGQLEMSNLQVQGDVDLSEGSFHRGIMMEAAHIDGSLFYRSGNSRYFCVAEDVNAHSLRLGGQIDLGGAQLDGNLVLESAEIQGDFFACCQDGKRFSLAEDFNAHSLKLGGQLNLGGAQLDGNLVLESAGIQGGLFVRHQDCERFTLAHDFNAHRLKLGGLMDLSGAKIVGLLNLQLADIPAGLWCLNVGPQLTEVAGEVDLVLAALGNTQFSGVCFRSKVKMRGARVDALWIAPGVYRDESTKAQVWLPPTLGMLSGPGLTVKGDLRLWGVQVAGAKEYNRFGIDLPGAEITGRLAFWDSHLVQSVIELHNLTCRNFSIEPIGLDGIEGEEDKRIEGARVEGFVNLGGARIHGSLDLRRLRVTGDGEQGHIDLEDMQIDGKLRCNHHGKDETRPDCCRLNLRSAHCKGDVDLSGMAFRQAIPGKTIDAEGLVVEGHLKLSGEREPEKRRIPGRVVLIGSRLGRLTLSGNCLHHSKRAGPMVHGLSPKVRWTLTAALIGLLLLTLLLFGLAADSTVGYFGWPSWHWAEYLGLSKEVSFLSIGVLFWCLIYLFPKWAWIANALQSHEQDMELRRNHSGSATGTVEKAREKHRRLMHFRDSLQVIFGQHFCLLVDDRRKNKKPALNLERAQIGRMDMHEPIPSSLELSNAQVAHWLFNGKENHAKFIDVLDQLCEFRGNVYRSIEADLRNRGDRDMAEQVHREMRQQEQWLEHQRWPTAWRLLHSRIGYGTQRFHLVVLMLVWYLFTASWLFWEYDRVLALTWESDNQVIQMEFTANVRKTDGSSLLESLPAGETKKSWCNQEPLHNPKRFRACLEPNPTDPRLEKLGRALGVAVRYHVPIIDLNVYPHLKVTGTTLAWYTGLVRLVHWILWPLLLASLLPIIIPKAETH